MKRRIGTIFAVILVVFFCAIGYVFFQKHNAPQLPSAFAQAQPNVGRIAYVDNGKLLLVHSYNGDNSLWDIASKQKVGEFHAVGTFWVSADGRQLMFERLVNKPLVSHLVFVRLPQDKSTYYHLQRDHDVKTWDVQYHVRAVSPDFSTLVASVSNHDLLLIDTKTQKVLSRRVFPVKYLFAPRFTRDGKFIIVKGTPNYGLVMNAADLTTFQEFPRLDEICFSRDHRFIYETRVNADQTESHLQILNRKTHQKTEVQMPMRLVHRITELADGNIRLDGISGDSSHHNITFKTAIFSTKGELLNKPNPQVAYASSQDHQWTGSIIYRHGFNPMGIPSPSLYEVKDSESGKTVHRLNFTVDPLGNDNFTYLRTYFGEPYSAISPDKSQIAIVSADGLIRFYDFPSKNSPPDNLYKSNSRGSIIARTDDQGITDYKISQDGSVSIQVNNNLLAATFERAWSRDNQLEATSDGRGIVTIRDENQHRIATISGTAPLYKKVGMELKRTRGDLASLAISPDKNYIAAGRADGTIYLYSVKSHLPVAQLGNAPSQPTDLKFSPDGKTLHGVTHHEVRSWKVPDIQS